ncbi:hypothetical protein BC834DRAFT_839825 [Gloeopeniophorella convolvens]|nr:hypothetical protein BC834DRAFT_839825 [Gloeopeniophorella convolvens]
MPRESSDARAALMAVYMSQRSSLPSPPETPPRGLKGTKAAERPLPRTHGKDVSTRSTLKNLKDLPLDGSAEACSSRMERSKHADLERVGRTIYGTESTRPASERRRRRRRRTVEHHVSDASSYSPSSPLPSPPRTPESAGAGASASAVRAEEHRRTEKCYAEQPNELMRREVQKGVMQELIEAAEERARVEAWVTRSLRGVDDKILLGNVVVVEGPREDVTHADQYFDMYINAEECGGY